MKYSTLILIIALLTFACSSDDNDSNTLQNQIVDTRDNQIYEIVTIGNQTWFAQNLNYSPANTTSECYQNDPTNCFIYGRLYQGDEALTACPDGWHLASVEEWETLFDYVGGIESAHNLLAPYAMQQGNLVGFNMLAGGWKAVNFTSLTERGYFWTSTEGEEPGFNRWITYKKDEYVSISESAFNVGNRMSCRCIKD